MGSARQAEAHAGRRVSDIAQAIEPYDKCWGIGASGRVVDPSPFERINLILDDTERTTNGAVSTDRGVIVTRVLRENIADPQPIRMAKAMAAYFRECSIEIYDNELIVATMGCPKKGAPIFPEVGIDWMRQEMEDGTMGYCEMHTHDYFSHTPEDYERVRQIAEAWRGRSVDQRLMPLLTEEELNASQFGQGVYLADGYMNCGPGHTGWSEHRLLEMGYGGIRDEIVARMAQLDQQDPADQQRMISLEADLIANQGATDFILRYAQLADDMAVRAHAAGDERRAGELEQIGANCRQIATGTPQTFWQCLQAVTFAHYLIQMESNGHSISYGRFDQYAYPFYERDLACGAMTREQMQELIENFLIKIWDMNKVRPYQTVEIFANGGIGGPCLTVGGIRADGTDGTNDVTFMLLDAVAHVRLPVPWTAVRVHKGTPENLWVKIANLIRLGLGEPKIFNDDLTVPMLVKNGRALEDARNYQVVGCVEPDVPGKEYGWHDSAYFNINRALEVAINHGYTNDGKKLGIDVGSLEDFTSFDQVLEAYEKEVVYFVGLLKSYLNKLDMVHQQVKPVPYLSNLIEGAVASGTDVSAGGAIYNYIGAQAVGVGSVGDGLATIKQLVFDEKLVTGRELLDAVRDNWVGHDELYALVNSDYVHHYGNDDDYADELAKFGIETYFRAFNGGSTAHGGIFQAACYSVSINVGFGQMQDASVEGRVSGEPISDNLGATHTICCPHDVKGPAAILRSTTKIDQSLAGNGALLNWKFSPSALEGDAGINSLIGLMKTYVARKGMHSQFTVASRETLVEAQRHPEQNRDLLVRVAGYSAYFVELSKGLQDDIIGRTELSF